MNLSHAQAVGFNNDVSSNMQKETATLDAAGLKTAMFIQNMKVLQEQVETANAHQESPKRQLKDATDNYNRLKQTMYVTASGYLDMMIAAVRKDSSAAENFRRIRSRIKRADHEASDAEPAQPVPVPSK